MIAIVRLVKSRAGVFCSCLVNQTEIFITVFDAALPSKIYYAINLFDQLSAVEKTLRQSSKVV